MEKIQPRHFVTRAPQTALRRLEVAHEGAITSAFLTFASVSGANAFVQKMQAQPDNQMQIVAQSSHTNGALLIVQTPEPLEAFIARVAEGEPLIPEEKKSRWADPWVWRGITSVIGQSLTLTSGFLGTNSKAGDKSALIGFASLNLMANAMNVTFGSQKKEDKNQLRFLANEANHKLEMAGASELPDVGRVTDALPNDGAEQTWGQSLYSSLQKYSVTGGEIGLRTIGATSLAFPITNWGKGLRAFQSGGLKAAFHAIKNGNPVTFYAGLATLAGKFTSLASKEPDPYSPEPASALRQFREKITFPLSSVIEGVAAGFMTHDRFARQKIRLPNGTIIPDYMGGIGNGIFIGGYGIRLAAPYGSLEVNMPKLYTHLAKGIASVPAEKRLQVVSDMALELSEHFAKPETHSAGQIFEGIEQALKKNHAIQLRPAELPKSTPLPQIQSPAVLTEAVSRAAALPAK